MREKNVVCVERDKEPKVIIFFILRRTYIGWKPVREIIFVRFDIKIRRFDF